MSNSFSGISSLPQYDAAWTAEASALSLGKSASDSPNRSKLENAAREFESTLLAKWLEEARHAFAGAPGGEDEEDGDDSAQSAILDLGMQSLARALTKSGGLGIARVLGRELQDRTSLKIPTSQLVKIKLKNH